MPERAARARSVATAKGRRVGRPSVVSAAQLAYAEQLRQAGETVSEIVAKTGITRSSLYRHLPGRPPEPVTAAGPAPTARDRDDRELADRDMAPAAAEAGVPAQRVVG